MNKSQALIPKNFFPGLNLQMMRKKLHKAERVLREVREMRRFRLLEVTNVPWIRWHLKWM